MKLFRFICFISVSADGVKHSLCKYLTRSCADLFFLIIAFIAGDSSTVVDFCEGVLVFLGIVIFHKPSPEVLLFPCKKYFLKAYSFPLLSIILQSSSHNCPRYIKLLCKLSNAAVYFSFFITTYPSGSFAFLVALNVDVYYIINSGLSS